MIDTTVKFPQMHDAFPDYDQSTLPEIPSTWIDTSWHKDESPSFQTPNGFTVHLVQADTDSHIAAVPYEYFILGYDKEGDVIDKNDLCYPEEWAAMIKWL